MNKALIAGIGIAIIIGIALTAYGLTDFGSTTALEEPVLPTDSETPEKETIVINFRESVELTT